MHGGYDDCGAGEGLQAVYSLHRSAHHLPLLVDSGFNRGCRLNMLKLGRFAPLAQQYGSVM
jgi:hypothetical protein